jgi:hypothetical protein
MRLWLVCLLFSNSVMGQIFLKSGVGYASAKGMLTEVDGGYRFKKSQFSLGYVYIPADYKSFYNVKYGHYFGQFNVHGGLGLVNKGSKDGLLQAYGTYVLGAEYNTKEILQNTRIYFGADLIEKDVNLKAGIRILYTDLIK